jgi:hypothetical protein
MDFVSIGSACSSASLRVFVSPRLPRLPHRPLLLLYLLHSPVRV